MVDCFHISRKKELYQIKHGPHTTLVYGYELEKRIFYIVDNQESQDTNYQKNTISFDELEAAYNGYKSFFNPLGKEVTLYIVQGKDAGSSQEYGAGAIRDMTLENIKAVVPQLPESRKSLDLMYENFVELTSEGPRMLANITQISHLVGEVLGAKRIELYKARTILEDEAMSKILEEIVNHLEYVLIVLAKMELSSTYGERSAIGMQGRMKEVVELESSYMSLVESL